MKTKHNHINYPPLNNSKCNLDNKVKSTGNFQEHVIIGDENNTYLFLTEESYSYTCVGNWNDCIQLKVNKLLLKVFKWKATEV